MNRLQFRVLYRQFLLRIIDLDLLAPQGDVTKLLGQFAALLAIVSLWVMTPAVGLAVGIPGEPELGLVLSWVGEHFLISSTMLVVGLFAVLSWESMFPDRRDVLVLSPLPVRGRTLFLAKAAAVATGLSLTVLTLDFFPGLFAPFAFSSAPAALPAQYDAAMAPLTVTNVKEVLDRDLIPAMTGDGALTSAKHAGVTIGVLEHGERKILAYGVAKPDSIFEIGSITKTFTALALAQMAEQGKVSLDQPLRELLPPGTVAKPQGDEITLLDLATHRSGLPQIPDNQKPNYDYSVANLYAYIAKHGVARPASQSFKYSNLGFGLLGQALANRANTTYPFVVQEEVTGPLGMRDTVVALSAEKDARLIPGYDTSNRPMMHWDHAGLAGAGSLHSTAGDMLTYLDAQLHPETFGTLARAIKESHVFRVADNPSNLIALGWAYNTLLGVYWHNGATAGYSSFAFFYPQGDFGGVVLLNTTPRIISFADQLGAHLGQRLAGLPAISLANPVIPGKEDLLSKLRSLAAFWMAMLAAGTFLFCAMLSVQGLAQLLPRQAFLRISAALQMTLFCLILTVYFAQPGFSSLESLAANQQWLRWLPSYWFFGLFQELNGTPLPAQLGFLVQRAWAGLGSALGGTALAYLICYFRTLRKIAEQPDILPSRAALHWLPRFGGAFSTAIVQFSIRTLLRSRQHRVILSFYLGLAFGLAIFFAKAPVLQEGVSGDPWHQANAEMIVASIVMMGAAVLGARVVFSLPLDLRANWIFRLTPIPGVPESMTASRWALYVLAVIPVWATAAAVFLLLWRWRAAAGHLVLLGLLGAIVAELCLRNFRKLPFTCSYLPGRSYAHIAVLSLIAVVLLIIQGAELERRALESPAGTAAMLGLFGILFALVRRRTAAQADSPGSTLQFEEAPTPAIMGLGLNRDGSSPV
jgi:CubicO group peptidase (beta-lactamase class C family)